MEEKLIDVLINTVNRIEGKIDRMSENVMTKEDCQARQEHCPLKIEDSKLRTWVDIIKESKLMIIGVIGGIGALIKIFYDVT